MVPTTKVIKSTAHVHVIERGQFFKIKQQGNITTQRHINDQHLTVVRRMTSEEDHGCPDRTSTIITYYM